MTDPRYDPRFQRGWDGRQPDPPPAPASPPVGASASAAVAPPPSRPDPLAPEAAPASADRVDDEAVPPRRNPYRIALVVLGVVLLAVAGQLVWSLAQTHAGQNSAAEALAVQLEYELLPVVVLAGIAALIVAIALGARRR